MSNAAQMDEYCKDKGFSAWFETSAKENLHIDEAARCLVTHVSYEIHNLIEATKIYTRIIIFVYIIR